MKSNQQFHNQIDIKVKKSKFIKKLIQKKKFNDLMSNPNKMNKLKKKIEAA